MYNLDEQILLFIQENIRNPILSRIFVPLTIIGNSGVFLVVVGIIMCIIKKTRRIGMVFLASIVIGFIINDIVIKNIVRRIRPFEAISALEILVKAPKSFSFPSGHTASFFAAATSLFYNSRRNAFVSLVIATAMGFSRMYVGVHYPSDVLAGMVVGVTSGAASIYLYKRLINEQNNKAVIK